MSERIAKVKSLVLYGRDAVEVCVEAMVTSPGIGIHLVGLPDRELKESLLRVCTAILSAGFSVPGAKIVINITPMQHGAGAEPFFGGKTSSLDAAIAIAILEASGQTGNSFFSNSPNRYVVGEIGLNGELREVPGMLSFIHKVVNAPCAPMLFLPRMGIPAGWEDIVGKGCDQVVAVNNIVNLVACTRNAYAIVDGIKDAATTSAPRTECTDFISIPGYNRAKRVMQVAAAGGFDIVFVDKVRHLDRETFGKMYATLLRESFRDTVFDHSTDAALNASVLGRYASAATSGFFPVADITPATGGINSAVIKAISAHNGVLSIEGVSGIGKSIIEALRTIHKEGTITISRLRDRVTYPAFFSLVISSVKGPVAGDPDDRVRGVVNRLCGGDQLWCWTDNDDKCACGLTTADVAASVRKAVERQVQRQDGRLNADLSIKELETFCVDKDGHSQHDFVQKVIQAVGISSSDYFGVLRTARTIADLDGSEYVSEVHICEAVAYKAGDRVSQ